MKIIVSTILALVCAFSAHADLVNVHATGTTFAGPLSGSTFSFVAQFETFATLNLPGGFHYTPLQGVSLVLGPMFFSDNVPNVDPFPAQLDIIPGMSFDQYYFSYDHVSMPGGLAHEQRLSLTVNLPAGTILPSLFPLPNLESPSFGLFSFRWEDGTTFGLANSITFSSPSGPGTPGAVPEPSTIGLIASAGLLFVAGMRNRKNLSRYIGSI